MVSNLKLWSPHHFLVPGLSFHCSCNPDFSIVTGHLLKITESWRWILSVWRTTSIGCTTSTYWSPAAMCWSPGSGPCSTLSPWLFSLWWCTQLTSSSPSTSAWLLSSSPRYLEASPKAQFPSWTELAWVVISSSCNLWNACLLQFCVFILKQFCSYENTIFSYKTWLA